jgi:WD40 repeat protein
MFVFIYTCVNVYLFIYLFISLKSYQNGTIFIVTIDQNQSSIIHKFISHEQEIQGLAWSTSIGKHYYYNHFILIISLYFIYFLKKKPPIGNLDGSSTLLASSAKDKTICVWNTESGVCEKKATLPAPMSYLPDPQKKRLNVALNWLPKSNQLIISTYR